MPEALFYGSGTALVTPFAGDQVDYGAWHRLIEGQLARGVDALVVPVPGGILTFLKQDKEGCMVPWNRILRIGDDVILVELHEDATAACE